MNSWKEIKDQIPNAKELTKGKKITLYKAFKLNDGDEMDIDVNFDLLSFTLQDAILNLINREGIEKIISDFIPSTIDVDTVHSDNLGTVISFAVFTFDKSEITGKDLVDNDMLTYEDGTISITLSDKLYKVEVVDMRIDEISIEIDPKTQAKHITTLKLTEVI